MPFLGPQIVVEREASYASLRVPGSEVDSEGIILLQKEVPTFLEESPGIVGDECFISQQRSLEAYHRAAYHMA